MAVALFFFMLVFVMVIIIVMFFFFLQSAQACALCEARDAVIIRFLNRTINMEDKIACAKIKRTRSFAAIIDAACANAKCAVNAVFGELCWDASVNHIDNTA